MVTTSRAGQCLSRSHIDADRDSYSGMISVVHVVAVVTVVNVNVVVVVPIIRPVAGPGIEHCYPIASVLEPGITIVGSERKTDDTKTMLRSKISAVTIIRNSIAVVTAALLPRAMD